MVMLGLAAFTFTYIAAVNVKEYTYGGYVSFSCKGMWNPTLWFRGLCEDSLPPRLGVLAVHPIAHAPQQGEVAEVLGCGWLCRHPPILPSAVPRPSHITRCMIEASHASQRRLRDDHRGPAHGCRPGRGLHGLGRLTRAGRISERGT